MSASCPESVERKQGGIHWSQLALLLVIVLLAGAAGCANSYSIKYKGAGEASKALLFAKDSEKKFHELCEQKTPPADIEAVRIFIDSIPEEVAVDGTTIGVREGVDAELIGSFRIIAQIYQPSSEEVIPVLQKAVFAAGANLAYCPPKGAAWVCYLVRTKTP